MKKQTKLRIISFFSLLFLLSFSVSVFAETETVTKIETYKSNDKNEKRESEKQFSKDGIKYKFLDETYEIVNQEDNFDNEIKTLTINKETRSKTYSPKKIIKKNGITYKLKNVENSVRKVKKKNGRKVTGYLSFDSKSEALSAPATRVFSANGATAKCKKKNMVKEKAASWQSSWIDFTFTSSDKDYYEWNGHEIDGKSKNPLRGNEDGKGLKVDAVEGEKKLRLGEGLLNDASKDVIKMRIVNLDRNKIRKNSKNNYSIKDIDSLAESIRIYGIASPLNVKKINDNEYMLLGGERRITAIDKLIEDPNVPEWNEDTLIPCTIKDLDKIKLPLSDEAKEQYALITTNKEARKYTDADRYIEVQAWKRIIDELRANGVDTINMEDKDIQIKGEKTRDILARTTGMSQGQIQRYNKVENNATANLINSVLDDEISIGVAERAVDILTPREQDSLAEAARSQKIAPIDVDTFKKEEPKEEYTDKVNSDVEELLENIKNKKIYFTEKQEREYTKLIKKLANILNK